jgi:Spy/CpxP family protein refolding chaperone
MRRVGSLVLAFAAVVALAVPLMAQPGGDRKPGDGDKGPGGGPRGFKGGPPRPGQLLPGFLQERLNLTAEQKKQVEELQKEVQGKLEKILTREQREELEEMRERFADKKGPRGPDGRDDGPREFGKKGPGGPPREGDKRGPGDGERKGAPTDERKGPGGRRGPEGRGPGDGDRSGNVEDRLERLSRELEAIRRELKKQ